MVDERTTDDRAATDDEILSEEQLLSDDARRARWQARRPAVEHLPSGTVADGEGRTLPLFDVGDRIVVERRTRLLRGCPWLETVVGRVASIDDDRGVVVLHDEDGDPRAPTARSFSLLDPEMNDFRLAPARGNPFVAQREVRPLAAAAQGRGRGRPRGSRNRPKETIMAEREEARRVRQAKRSSR